MPMPGMKALKGIGRRKSGTPGLDDGAQVPSSSFRVIPRDEANRKSVGGALDKPLPVVTEYRRTWSEEDTNSSNRYVEILSSREQRRMVLRTSRALRWLRGQARSTC